jgi:hypothetical protein
MKHFKFGGSTAKRTIECPSWADEAAKNPQNNASEAAAEGTALHEIMEQLIEDSESKTTDFIGLVSTVDGHEILIDEDHVERLDMALEAFLELDAKYKFDDVLIEAEFKITDEIGGTCDILAYTDTHVIVLDWKFGQGIAVDPVENAQGMFYAMCAEHMMPELFKGKQIVIAIVQPMPSRHDIGTLKTWEVPAGHFGAFKKSYTKSVMAKGYKTGSHCTFCPGAATCPLKIQDASAALRMDATDLDSVSEAMAMVVKLEPWIKEVKKIAHEQLEQGAAVTGWKLVDKRATRKWLDEAKALEVLSKLRRIKKSEYMAPSALKSVAQLEKTKFDMSVVSDYIIKSSTGTTMAPASDPRDEALSEATLRAALNQLA